MLDGKSHDIHVIERTEHVNPFLKGIGSLKVYSKQIQAHNVNTKS